jgi:hypothetical protein
MLHGVSDEMSLGELARSVSRLVGAAGRSPCRSWRCTPGGGGAGVSLSLNKRLASQKTRELLAWKPTRRDILEDVEHVSYSSVQ